MSLTIRPYSPTDRETVRRICCDTGFSGSPVDPLFCDRDVFADYLTRYYTDWEPESAFIAEDDGEVVGYLLGSVRPRRHEWAQAWILCAQVAPKALLRLLTGQYNQASRNFLWWCMTEGSKQTPDAPKHGGHLHFNLLPAYRAQGGAGGVGARLLVPFVKWAQQNGLKRVYGQIQTTDDRRTERVFNKFGFHTYDKKEITKFRPFHDNRVYVSTVVRELK
ncbi:MAG: GNAT family N-acetyltransferase [Candidatus Hinthialibacter antarcticus]|nr:GNAT family N-acetyltransferase [Candidatus Hinthialibacter antarcticus]